MARLHVICGNCGCSDDWEYRTEEDLHGDGNSASGLFVWLFCGNCSTLHNLSDNAKRRITTGGE